MNASEFRTGFLRLDEPATVTDGKSGRVIGTWFPGGHECAGAKAMAGAALGSIPQGRMLARQFSDMEERAVRAERERDEALGEIANLKRQLAQRTSGEPRYAPGTPEAPERPNPSRTEVGGLSREAQRAAQDAILARDRRLRSILPKPKGKGE